jgi:hypothetical protein
VGEPFEVTQDQRQAKPLGHPGDFFVKQREPFVSSSIRLGCLKRHRLDTSPFDVPPTNLALTGTQSHSTSHAMKPGSEPVAVSQP